MSKIVTLSVIIINIIIYTLFTVFGINLQPFCYNPNTTLTIPYLLKRIFTTLIHGNIEHLLVNMSSMNDIGFYESFIGSSRFGYIIALFTILTTLLDEVILYYTNSPAKCLIGFSGVLFALQVYSIKYTEKSLLFGKETNKLTAILANLILTHFLVPNSSTIGHLAGFIIGYIALKLF